MGAPKWTEERTSELVDFVGDESPVSQDTVQEAAERLDTSTRSIAAKLRKMEYDVTPASHGRTPTFSDAQAESLAELVTSNSGNYTYEELAVAFEGDFSSKQIQGKILSMQLTEHVKAAPVKETVKSYTDEEEAQFVELVNGGSFAEEIAEALGKTVESVRGKGLSLLRAGRINNVPKQKETKGKVDAFAELGDVTEKTVEEIAEALGKTERGVRTILTRRGVTCANYDGKARKEKAAAAS